MLEGYIQQYGLLFLLCVCVLEGAMLLYFAPSEALVPVSLTVLGVESILGASAVVGTAVAGCSLGQIILYIVLDTKGRQALKSRFLPVNEKKLDSAFDLFRDHGFFAIAITNALPFVRGTMTFPAGLSDYEFSKFVLASVIGTIIFQGGLALATLQTFNWL